ncbi:Hypothetical protein R9X50_00232400 [Acrodontium crateriforme]|uniref:Uncharacterized protein n=1 Tax=Acrodontium crateriforme TaxID=150365 RepID=A0AAQ3M287_9PEZI|nr:Hypothetical protein R9X50_00232400 [Acrodontium crateriforme]
MDLQNCRRILAIGAPGCGILKVVEDLTGSAPSKNDDGSTAGITHEWNAQTAYYKAKVPIWIDDLIDVDKWSDEFRKYEAKEVVTAVGAWVYCFSVPNNGSVSKEVENTLKAIHGVVEHHTGYVSDTLLVAVAVAQGKDSMSAASSLNNDDWEDACSQYGFEFINYQAQGVNEFGERLGRDRLRETLEANEWDATDGDELLDLDDLDFDADDDGVGFGRDEAELTGELYGMKHALRTGGDEGDFDPNDEDVGDHAHQVDDLDRLMSRLLAVKEQATGLPDAERKRLAAQAVRDLMGQSV